MISVLGTPLDSNGLTDTDAEDESDDDGGGGLSLGRDAQGVEVTATGLQLFKKMEDVEIVLRFFAYRHFDKFTQGLNKISEFLDEFLVRGNRFDKETLAEYERIFVGNIVFWYTVGGPVAFQVKGSNRHFSKIAFDALMFASSAFTAEQRAELLSEPTRVEAAIDAMYEEHSDVFGGRKTNAADARRRNERAYEALSAALNQIEG